MEGCVTMPYCTNCGNEVNQSASVCPNCGTSLNGPQADTQYNHPRTMDDDNNALWGIIGFCVPIAGLILFIVWNQERPSNAKAAGLGALVNVGLGFIVVIFAMIAAMAGV